MSADREGRAGRARQMRAPRRILIVLHQKNSTPGRVGQILAARGFELDMRRPRFGEALPRTMDAHDGAVIFGGPMSANDNDSYVRREIDWISVPLRAQKPFLGICLGAQMLVRHLGASVAPHPGGQAEIGYYPLTPTAEGAALLDWPKRVYQWHREGFDLPRGAQLLAKGSGAYPHQAMRWGPAAFGIQFHPEVTHAMMVRWTTKAAPRMRLPGAQKRQDHFAGRFIFDPAVRLWLSRFLDIWLESGNTR